MIIIHQAFRLDDYLREQREKGNSIGFVPTMGALHEGHLELIRRSNAACDITVCSIFVNPTQFNDSADFKKYPQRLENDLRLLISAGAAILYLPDVGSVYPGGTTGLENYDIGYLETILEGKYRPGHFQGVSQVMKRLLDAVKPDQLFMGQKDYQQCLVVNRLLTRLDYKVTLVTVPTLRESDGLAMSSRNLRLTEADRTRAPKLYRTLQDIQRQLKPGDLADLKNSATTFLESEGFRVDYVEIADAQTLEPVNNWNGEVSLVALVAAFDGEVRLIDNLLLNS